ncbi:MAG TPA: NAD(P)-binding protein [Pseudomonadales bacterium]
MGRGITRRDFVAGISIPIAGAAAVGPGAAVAARGSVSDSAAPYPPALTGLRGSHPGSFEVAHALARDGVRWPRPARQTDPTYDLVVVGAGISGLAAAYLFRAQVGPDARILILDNHDDFGGHAKRNELRVGGRTLLGYGGSQSIDSPATYSRVARGLLRELGIETERFRDYFDRGFDARHGLRPGILFQADRFGASRLSGWFLDAADAAERDRWLSEYPLDSAAREALRRLAAGELPGEALAAAFANAGRIRTEDFLRETLAMPEEGLAVLRDQSLGFWGFGLDGLSLRESLEMGALGPALTELAEHHGALRTAFGSHGEEPYIFHFPDGNAGIARALVRSLIPDAIPGRTMEDLVRARARYDRLDRPENGTRIRLSSTAVEVRNAADGVDVTYVRGGEAERVHGRCAILACYNNIIPHLCPEMGEAQRRALDYPEKIPLVVMNIALRHWRPIAESGFGEVYTPGGFLVGMGLDFPVSMGGYRFSRSPDEPVVLDCWHAGIDSDRTLHVFERLRRGRHAMLARPFEAYEAAARAQLVEAWGDHGFDPDRDIAAITVNRWPHGYAWEYTDLWDEPGWSRGAGPHVIGRQQLGRISIANSDSESFAYVNGAIDAAYRAVREQTTP